MEILMELAVSLGAFVSSSLKVPPVQRHDSMHVK
jgi:hypothetical protein